MPNVKRAIYTEFETALRNVEMGLNGYNELAQEALRECAERLWNLYLETQGAGYEHYALWRAYAAVFYELLPITRTYRNRYENKRLAFHAAVSALGIPVWITKKLPDKEDETDEVSKALASLRRYFEADEHNETAFDENK